MRILVFDNYQCCPGALGCRTMTEGQPSSGHPTDMFVSGYDWRRNMHPDLGWASVLLGLHPFIWKLYHQENIMLIFLFIAWTVQFYKAMWRKTPCFYQQICSFAYLRYYLHIFDVELMWVGLSSLKKKGTDFVVLRKCLCPMWLHVIAKWCIISQLQV